MHAFRFIRIALLACTLTACAGRGPATTPPTLHNSQPPTLSDLLRPYEISARKTSATEAPVVGGTFDATHSVPVPAELGRRAFGTTAESASGRETSAEVAQSYAMIATMRAPTASGKQRAVKVVGYCYFLVTYLYNVNTGAIVAILSVRFLGCDTGDGIPEGGGGGGDGGVPPPDPPPNAGCGNAQQTAGKAYADIGSGNPVFNDPNPNSNAPNGTELYGYIYSNGGGEFRYDPPTSVNLATGRDAAINGPNDYPGWHPVGLYHTHPHGGGETSQIDQDTGNHFSATDIATATANMYPIYVAVQDTLAQNDLNENAQVRWYKYDPATGQETLINTVGSGGC